MGKYLKPLTKILREVVEGMTFPVKINSVVPGSETVEIFCCDIYHAQVGYTVTIDGNDYKIEAFSQANESLVLKPKFTGSYTIAPGTTFQLYGLHFFHGTPITTDTELKEIEFAADKVPMIWLWENFTETVVRDSLIERYANGIELYALTQSPEQLQQMSHSDIMTNCVEPMRRAAQNLRNYFYKRTDIFSTDFSKFDFEEYPKFGIVARKKGSERKLMADFLSGCGIYTDFELYYKDDCIVDSCDGNDNVPKGTGIGYMEIGTNFIVS